MTVTVPFTPQYEFSIHDLCYSAWVLLNCSGRVRYEGPETDETAPGYSDIAAGQVPQILGQCGNNSISLTQAINAAVVDTAAGGQTNTNVARRRVAPTRGDLTGSVLSGARLNPIVWQIAEVGAPILHPTGDQAGTGPAYTGTEDPVASATACPTCGSAASCANEVALLTIHNAWCGDSEIPNYPYVAVLQKSLAFEPVADTFTLGQGFGTGRTFNYTLRNNALFQDPWGIDPRGAGSLLNNKWSIQLIHTSQLNPANQAGWSIQDLVANCNCIACSHP